MLWLTYGSFYFCRNNLGVALPGLQAELGYTKSELGTVLMALKLAYGVGQFINGQLAEHWPPRKLLAVGLLASAALNVVVRLGDGALLPDLHLGVQRLRAGAGLAADDARRGELVSRRCNAAAPSASSAPAISSAAR